MKPLIDVNADTRLTDILEAYPWLPDALIQRDSRFRKIKSPLAKPLISRFRVADAAKFAGYPAERLIEELGRLVESRED